MMAITMLLIALAIAAAMVLHRSISTLPAVSRRVLATVFYGGMFCGLAALGLIGYEALLGHATIQNDLVLVAWFGTVLSLGPLMVFGLTMALTGMFELEQVFTPPQRRD